MHKTSKKSRFGGWWKALAVVMIFGYTMSSVLAYDLSGDQIVSLQSSVSSLPAPSFQKQIETEVALGAQTLWTNLVAFMQQGMKTDSDAGFTSQPESPVGLPESHVDLPVTSSVLQYVATTSVPAFGDIDNDANKASIELLTSIGVFKVGENGKFYPNNFVRCSDFIRVIVDVYRYKLGYPLDGQMGLLDKPYFDPANKDTLLLKKLNTAQALGLLDKLDAFMLDEHITPAQAKQIFNNILDLNPYIGQKEKVNQISSSNSLITKSQLA